MSRHDLTVESSRFEGRPSGDPKALMGLLVVRPAIDAERYAARLRLVLGAAVRTAIEADFDSDEVPFDLLPDWFHSLTDGGSGGLIEDSPGTAGKHRYLEVRENRPWDVEEWVYCFDPELRAWAWWDITAGSEGRVNVWLDTKGEGHIPCEELWWAAFLAGAEEISPLTLEDASTWKAQQSIGLSQ